MNDKDHYAGDDDSHDRITSIDELIEHIMKMFSNSITQNGSKPLITGFTIIGQPGKKPVVFDLNSQRETEPFEYEEENDGDFYLSKQEPFIDIFETDNKVFMLADLGVEAKHVEYHAYGSHVEMTVITPGTGYSRVIELPCKVDPDSMVTSYRNGVLELAFEYAADTQ
ncbi:MAG: hypothetical protein QCH31_06910 [Methanolobus sp.]|nr:hypothetical protein [Methanolobus sp.]